MARATKTSGKTIQARSNVGPGKTQKDTAEGLAFKRPSGPSPPDEDELHRPCPRGVADLDLVEFMPRKAM